MCDVVSRGQRFPAFIYIFGEVGGGGGGAEGQIITLNWADWKFTGEKVLTSLSVSLPLSLPLSLSFSLSLSSLQPSLPPYSTDFHAGRQWPIHHSTTVMKREKERKQEGKKER